MDRAGAVGRRGTGAPPGTSRVSSAGRLLQSPAGREMRAGNEEKREDGSSRGLQHMALETAAGATSTTSDLRPWLPMERQYSGLSPLMALLPSDFIALALKNSLRSVLTSSF